MNSKALLPLAVALASTTTGCHPDSEGSESQEQGILNGIGDADGTRHQSVRIMVLDGNGNPQPSCSGALVTNDWMLSAHHCFHPSTPVSRYVVRYGHDPATMQTQTIQRLQRFNGANPTGPRNDVILAKLSAPFTVNGSARGFSRAMWPGASADLVGRTVECAGYGGFDAADRQSGLLRRASLPVFRVTPDNDWGDIVFYRNTNPDNPHAGRITRPGDSGSGCFLAQDGVTYRVSVHGADADRSNPTQGQGSSTADVRFRSWFARSLMSAGAAVAVASNQIAGAPSASSRGLDKLDLFWVENDGSLSWRPFDGGWGSTQSLGKPSGADLQGEPASVSWNAGRIDVFVRGSDNRLWQRFFDNGGWVPGWFERPGVVAMSSPAVSSWGRERLDLFVRGHRNDLQHAWFDGSWHGWESLGGPISGSPAAVSWGRERIDVIALGPNNTNMLHKWFDGSWGPSLTTLESLGGGTFQDRPAITSWGPGRLDIFARQTSGSVHQLVHRWFEGRWVNQWIPSVADVPRRGLSATSWGPGRIDLFSAYADGSSLWRSFYPRP